MRKFLLTLAALLLIKTATAQSPVVFCPPGAEWSYSFVLFIANYYVYPEKVTYVGDSIIGQDTVKKLSHYYFFKEQNYPNGDCITLIKQKGDTIFMSSKLTLNTWQILYNFAAQPGQVWTTAINYMTSAVSGPSVICSVVVDSVGSTIVNGFNLKVLYVKSYQQGYPNGTVLKIVERFGASTFLFNYDNLTWETDAEALLGPLCYTDNSFGSIQYTDKPCNYTDVAGIKTNKMNDLNIAAYPNPTKDKITLNYLANYQQPSKVIISNTQGEQVLSLDQLYKSQEIDLSSLKSGIYFMKIESESNQQVLQIIKE